MRAFRGGFSLTEMLIVMTIVVALLALGIVSLNALTAKKNTRLAAQSLVGAMRAARQYAISNRTHCLVEIIPINDNTAARPLPAGTPYLAAAEGPLDKVRILPMRSVRTQTGAYQDVLVPGALKEFELPQNCVFDDAGGAKRYYPQNAVVDVDDNEDGVPDGKPVTKIFFEFLPDGSCLSPAPQSTVPGGADNLVRIRDLVSGETCTVVVMPNTGYATTR